MSTLAQNVAKLSVCLSAAYAEIELKGGTVGDTKTATNLSAAIESIPSGGGTKYGCGIESMFGNVNADGQLQPRNDVPCDLTFDGVKTLAATALAYAFTNNNNIRSVSFPDLSSMDTATSMLYTFYSCRNLTAATFPSLQCITKQARQCFAYSFSNASNLSTVAFPELTSIEAQYPVSSMFLGTSLTSVYFPKLKYLTSTRGAMAGMFDECWYLSSIEFPSIEAISAGITSAYATFRANDHIKKFSFPALSSVTGTYLFSACTDLTCIQLPSQYQQQLTASAGYATKWDAPNANCIIEWI